MSHYSLNIFENFTDKVAAVNSVSRWRHTLMVQLLICQRQDCNALLKGYSPFLGKLLAHNHIHVDQKVMQ